MRVVPNGPVGTPRESGSRGGATEGQLDPRASWVRLASGRERARAPGGTSPRQTSALLETRGTTYWMPGAASVASVADGGAEGRLLGEEGAEAVDALPDRVLGRVAERQPHTVPSAAVRVEGGSGHVCHSVFHGQRQEGWRVHTLQGRPHVESAGGAGPRGGRGELALQRLEHRVAPGVVHAHQGRQVGPPPVSVYHA